MAVKKAELKDPFSYTTDELQNLSREELTELLQQCQTAAVGKDANLGIIRTRQGALMVRVSDDRWPIAMYRRDWEILLSKVKYIQAALDELDIPMENPNKANPAIKAEDLVKKSA